MINVLQHDKRDAIIIFGDTFTFPEGNAATNRVYTFAKGFHENGIEVFVICFRNDYVETVEDTINEIHYYHPFYQTSVADLLLKEDCLSLISISGRFELSDLSTKIIKY